MDSHFYKLPIDDAVPQIFDHFNRGALNLAISAQTGAGKTTRLPVHLDRYFEPKRTAQRPIVVLEPRRVLAASAAQRIAAESKTQSEHSPLKLGQEVGFQVRGQSQISDSTRICFFTEGLFLNHLISGRWRDRVPSVLIFDEFHERTREADLILSFMREQQVLNDLDTKLIVMSATLETERLCQFLGSESKPAALVHVPGRLFPVEVQWSKRPLALRINTDWYENTCDQIAEALSDLSHEGGDVLVFLPGRREIRTVRRQLEQSPLLKRQAQSLSIHELHGGLSLAEQSDLIRTDAQAGHSRIILSTNIAESSVTIPGVRAVIDSGLERSSVRLSSGLECLKLGRISRSSAEQRKGRAGRTAPGRCYRMWSELDHSSLDVHPAAKILSEDPVETRFLLAQLGYRDLQQIEWYVEPKNLQDLIRAELELIKLGLLDDSRELTEKSKALIGLGLPLKVALFWSEVKTESPGVGSWIAALLSEQDVLRDQDRVTLQDRLELVQNENSFLKSSADRSRLDAVSQLRRTLLKSVPHLSNTSASEPRAARPDHSLNALPQSVVSALIRCHLGQVAQRRSTGDMMTAVLAGGGEVELPKSLHPSGPGPDYYLILKAETVGASPSAVRSGAAQASTAGSDRLVASLVLPIDEADLLSCVRDWIEDRAEVVWNERDKQVTAFHAQMLLRMPIGAKTRIEPPQDIAEALLTEKVFEALSEDLGPDSLRSLKARIEFWATLDPAVASDLIDAWPKCLKSVSVKESRIRAQKKTFHLHDLAERDSITQLARESLSELLPQFFWKLDAAVPSTIELPNARTAHIEYRQNQRPRISVRLQHLLGLVDTPKVGTHPHLFQLELELLGPHGRPIQLTQDLRRFWTGSYQDIRKEMRGRYPKHRWPADPINDPTG